MTGRIIGLGAYIPKKVVTNDDFAKFLDTSDEWITERTGIKERHIADHITEKPSTMAVEAAKKAIEDAGIELTDDELDGIAGGLRHDLFADRHDGPTGGKSEQMPTVVDLIR